MRARVLETQNPAPPVANQKWEAFWKREKSSFSEGKALMHFKQGHWSVYFLSKHFIKKTHNVLAEDS